MPKKNIILFLFCSSLFSIFNLVIFYPIFKSNNIIISFAIHPFNICSKYPKFWFYFKIFYIIILFISSISISYILINLLFKSKEKRNISTPQIKHQNLNITVGYSKLQNHDILLNEKALYQNILITGTIGTGKTSSAIYPFSEQLIKYKSNNPKEKLGILCLDVKGNFYNQIKFYAKKYNRLNDLIIIGLNSKETYNPLDKPNLNSLVLANRLKTILTLLSPNNSESFWLDKAEQIIAESIKLCRLYNNNYVNFSEIHKLINNQSYYVSKVNYLRNLFLSNKFSNNELYNLTSAITFFENEFFKLDERTISILKSEISRITLPFISDYNISKLFSPQKNNITFRGFQNLISSGKIVVLSMNISEFTALSKIIATYMKLDFQAEVMSSLNKKNSRSVAFICDEYQEYITSSDANFFSESREAKCINIVSTQSYSSLLHTIKDESALKVIIQNLVNKLWFRTDDIFTIESAQKQIGKEDKKKISKTISENAQESNYNYLIQRFKSKNSNISESVNTYYQYDYIYDSHFFTQELETFSCLAFLSDGVKAIPPQKIDMYPYFKERTWFYKDQKNIVYFYFLNII